MLKLNSFAKLFIVLVLVTAFFINCDDDDNPVEPQESVNFDIVGSWATTKIGSSTEVDGTNSTWTFKSDGTYTWFLDYAFFNESGDGTYTLSGTSLTVTGIVAMLYEEESKTLALTIGNDNKTFDMDDPDGDSWTYKKQ